MSSFIPRNLTEKKAVAGCTFSCTCNTVFCMFSCLQINCRPLYLRPLLKFHPFDWLIELYLHTEGQGTHRKMVSLQPVPGFSPLLYREECNFTGSQYYLEHWLKVCRRVVFLGTLRNEDLAIGRRLLLRHLITTSWQKESALFDPYANDEDGSRNMPWSSEQVGLGGDRV